MSNEALTQFANQTSLNLESVKRGGISVRTPVRFAGDDGVINIFTLANEHGVAILIVTRHNAFHRFLSG